MFKASDSELQREVAIKVLLPELSRNEEFRKRFTDEAKFAARLNHPNVVTVYEVGELEGLPFIAMELAEGTMLDTFIGKTGPLPFSRALEITRALADALSVAHSIGIIHRDIKPSNIILDASDRPKLMDFGLGKRLDVPSDLTLNGTILGTPSHMSPEQCRGESADARSDIFSLGLVLLEMLTGSSPLRKGTPRKLIAVGGQSPLPRAQELRSSTPPEIDAIVSRMVAHNRDARYSSAREVLEDITSWLKGDEVRLNKRLLDKNDSMAKTLAMRGFNMPKEMTILFIQNRMLITSLMFITVVAAVFVTIWQGQFLSLDPEETEIAVVIPYKNLSHSADDYMVYQFVRNSLETAYANVDGISVLPQHLLATEFEELYHDSKKSLSRFISSFEGDGARQIIFLVENTYNSFRISTEEGEDRVYKLIVNPVLFDHETETLKSFPGWRKITVGLSSNNRLMVNGENLEWLSLRLTLELTRFLIDQKILVLGSVREQKICENLLVELQELALVNVGLESFALDIESRLTPDSLATPLNFDEIVGYMDYYHSSVSMASSWQGILEETADRQRVSRSAPYLGSL